MSDTNPTPKFQVRLPLILAATLALGMFIGQKLPRYDHQVRLLSGSVGGNGTLDEILRYVEAKYVDSVNVAELKDEAIAAVLDHLDPHSSYISPEERKALDDEMQGEFEGVGIEYLMVADTMQVVAPLSDGPAEKAGVIAGDRIIQIDGMPMAGVKVNTELIYKKLRGLKIVSSSAGSSPGAMLAFNLNENSISRMRLFYHVKADTSAKNFDFYFEGANKFTHYVHELQGSPAGQLIDHQADEKLYLQGMHGVRVKVEFPNAQYLDNIAVNQAQLVLTVADNNTALTPASQLIFTQLQGDTVFVLTGDVLESLGTNLSGGFLTFGGSPKSVIDNGTTVTRYRLTLSELFQDIVDDVHTADTKNRTVYLGVYPRSKTADRSVLYGPKSLSFPAKVELTYTKLK